MKHDIRLEIEGALLEKLLHRALAEGAAFNHVQRTDPRRMLVDTNPAGAEKLFSLCKKYGYGCRIIRRGGWIAFLNSLRMRWTVLPGLMLGAVLCALFLSRIWLIDIQFTGETAHLGKPDEIIACLQEWHIHPGTARSAVDADLLGKQLLARIPSLSHAGIRLQGIRLLAEISPEAPAPDIYEIDYARDLVAQQSGVIEEIDIYSGQACVKPGDTVLRGETLIRGEENTGKNTETGTYITKPVGALGKVTARCWFEGSAQAQLNSTASVRTGNRRTSSRITLMGISLPILESQPFAAEETETEILPVVGVFLPLQIERSIHHETALKTASIRRDILEERLIALARADALQKISAELKEYKITSFWTDVTQNENTLHVRAVYEISTDIAVERDALIEEVY